MSPRLASRRSRALLLLFPLVALACSGTGNGAGMAAPFRGVVVDPPIPKPSFTLSDFNGRPYDFHGETKDKVALLFFGYTHCPDVCPVHMANIAAVLKQMPWEERLLVRVVFVTTDPDRDTPARLKEWLGNFDASFVGLTGTSDELNRVRQSLGIGEPQREIVNADSVNYFVAHAAQVFAFARDGNGYLEYPFGIRQEDWANDLPKLARDGSGAQIRRALAAAARESRQNVVATAPRVGPTTDVATGALTITRVVIAEPPTQSEAALYLVFNNDTRQADTLVAVASEVAVTAELHEPMKVGPAAMREMTPLRAIPIPAGAETRLEPGGRHVMMLNLRSKLSPGDTTTVHLSLARAGAVTVKATVVRYADLEKLFKQDPDSR